VQHVVGGIIVARSGIHDAVRGRTESVHAQSQLTFARGDRARAIRPCEGAWLMALISGLNRVATKKFESKNSLPAILINLIHPFNG
jgi:hypothetical protein